MNLKKCVDCGMRIFQYPCIIKTVGARVLDALVSDVYIKLSDESLNTPFGEKTRCQLCSEYINQKTK